MKRILSLFFVLLFSISTFNGYSQNKLDKSKDDLNTKSESKSSGDKTSSSSNSSSSESEIGNIFAEIFLKIFLAITYYPVIGDYNNEDHLHNNLTKRPYENGFFGNYSNSDSLDERIMRFDIENDVLLSFSNIYGNHLKAKYRPNQVIYIQGDYIQLFESDLKEGHSNLSLFYLNLCYDRLRFEKFNLGWTFGANYVGNEVRKAGVNFGFNAEFFLNKPISLYSSIRLGKINDANVNNFEFKVKYHKKTHFLSAGFENYQIGTPSYNFFTIGGGFYF